MTLKIAAASEEEHRFAAEVTKRLADTGVRVVAFSMVNPENEAKTYHLTFQLGTKRHTVTADAPFHYDAPEDVIGQVKDWVAQVRTANRWSTEVPADG